MLTTGAAFLGLIPRLDCLGLIEASGTATDGFVATGFRGLIASASLKRDRSDRAVEHPGGFRGLIASASLKLGLLLLPRCGLEIPRLDCLGLIEAWPASSSAVRS